MIVSCNKYLPKPIDCVCDRFNEVICTKAKHTRESITIIKFVNQKNLTAKLERSRLEPGLNNHRLNKTRIS